MGYVVIAAPPSTVATTSRYGTHATLCALCAWRWVLHTLGTGWPAGLEQRRQAVEATLRADAVGGAFGGHRDTVDGTGRH